MRSASGKSTSTSSRMQRAKSSAVRRSVTLTLRQERWASTKTKRLTAVAAILVVEALEPSGCGRDRLARFADELGGAFVEADHGPLRVRLLGIEVEHILHAGDVLGVDLGDAPHVLLPRLEMVL